MSADPAPDILFPASRPGPRPTDRDSQLIGPERYCELLLARRRIERLQHGIPRGFQGLRDPHTGETWLIREESLLRVS